MFQQHMDEVGAQISYWTAQGAQRASFTIGSAEDGPLEVKLSFTDGELAVAFETDKESVREVLQNGAQEALQRLMEAQGISLGQVSVGGGRTNTPQDNHPAEQPTLDLARRGRGVASAASAAQSPVSPRVPNIMTATKLDFYA
jgi:flagellar hook-length control protein FliK